MERLEERQDVAARAAEEQITCRAKERLDAAIADFEARAERALAEGRRELAARGDALRSEIDRRLDEWAGERASQLSPVEDRIGAEGRIERALEEATEATDRLEAAWLRVAGAQESIDEALARADHTLARFSEAERRALEVERRVAATERRIAGAVETAVRAADWESRLVAAVQVEEGVARRIAEAERRLLRAINEPRPPAAPAN